MTAQSGLGFSGIVAIQIPDDGAPGEVLTKITADNYDYDWAPGGGGGGPATVNVGTVTGQTLVWDNGALSWDPSTILFNTTGPDGIDVIGTLIDLDNSGAATASTILNRNSAGGITLNVNATTGDAQIGQTSGAGAAEDVWINFARDAEVTLRFNNADVFQTNATAVQIGTPPQRLLLGTNVAASYGGFTFYPDAFTRTVTGQSSFVWNSTLTSSIPGGGPIGNETAPNFVSWQGEVILTEQGNLFNTQSLFNQGTTVTCQGANTGPIYTMINQPRFRVGALGGARTGSQQNAVRSQLRMGPNIAGTFTLTSHETYFATCIMDGSGGAVAITTCNYFAPKAPTGMGATATIGTLNLIDFPNIPITGISSLNGIRSDMVAGTFINHTGSAPSIFNGNIQIDADLLGLQLGESQDILLAWSAANFYFWQFAASTDQLRWSNPSTNRYILETENGSADGEMDFGFNQMNFGTTGAVGNQAFNFQQNARTVTVAGGYSSVLFTAAGNLNLGVLAMSDVSAWVVNALSFDNTAYSISELATMKIGGMTTSNPGGTVTERAGLWTTGRHLHRGSWQVVPISPAALGAGNNNDWAGLLTGSPNNNTRYWARISGNAVTSVITGIDATAVQDGDTFELTNVSANAIDITDQDAASTAANRIITPTGVTYTLSADETVVIRYDSTTTRWRLLGGTGA